MQKRIRGLENALADRSAHQARYLGFIDDIGEALGVYGLPRAICGKIRDDAEILRTMVTAKHEEAERQASGSK